MSKTKNCMLDYLTEIMEHAQVGFCLRSPRPTSVSYGEGKVNWHITEKIDRIRSAHAQNIVSNPSSQGKKYKVVLKVPHASFFSNG